VAQYSAADPNRTISLFDCARRTTFDDKEPADLTVAIGQMNAYNRLAISVRYPPSAAGRGQ